MDRKAAYHTCFACDDLAGGESVFQSSLQHRPIVPVVDDGPAVPLDDALSATDLVRAMKVGWNLGGSPGGLAPPAPPRSGWGEASSPSRSAP